ncbi:hypothetical protein HMPREF2660_02775 [Weeksella sp. HMSC059D05]|nr:hypothetical protein HMPREF2660_02775 [Weeksella sp. HMSC059D05]
MYPIYKVSKSFVLYKVKKSAQNNSYSKEIFMVKVTFFFCSKICFLQKAVFCWDYQQDNL